MSANVMSLKAQIKNLAKKKNIKAQVLLQNYMFERFLERLSLSKYKDKFVLKGGVLIATIVGMDSRSTMDLDATLTGLPFTEKCVRDTITAVCDVALQDDVSMIVGTVTPIRSDDIYGGYRVKITASYDVINIPFSVDISTGDVITPEAVKHIFNGIIDDKKQIELWAYNIETILAEKIETILRRTTLNTRARDFYDVFILCTTQNYDRSLFNNALSVTASHRGTTEQIADVSALLKIIADSSELRQLWKKYQMEYEYAKNISYDQIMNVLNDVCDL